MSGLSDPLHSSLSWQSPGIMPPTQWLRIQGAPAVCDAVGIQTRELDGLWPENCLRDPPSQMKSVLTASVSFFC